MQPLQEHTDGEMRAPDFPLIPVELEAKEELLYLVLTSS